MIDEKFLESVGITDKDIVQKITETYATDMKTVQDKAETLQKSLDEAGATIRSYKDMDVDSIKASVEDYKQKLEQSEAARAEFEHRTKIDQYVKGLQLKDDIYEKYVTDMLMEKQLKFEGDKLIGGEDVVNAFRETHADAFAPNPVGRAAAPTSSNPPQAVSGVEAAFYEMNPSLKK